MSNASSNRSSAADYSIGADPELSRQVRQEFVDTLVTRTGIDPQAAARELADRDLASAFEERFSAMGLSRTELPDVLAAHVLSMWSIVHDSEFPSSDIASAVSRQLAISLRGRPDIADAKHRQLVGEALMYESVLSLEARDQARAAGDNVQLKDMAETAQRNTLNRQAINLKKTRLTSSGLQRV